MIYKCLAYWPNVTVEPEKKMFAHYAEALDWAIKRQASHEHTTIQVLVDQVALELARLWGQPMLDGKAWP